MFEEEQPPSRQRGARAVFPPPQPAGDGASTTKDSAAGKDAEAWSPQTLGGAETATEKGARRVSDGDLLVGSSDKKSGCRVGGGSYERTSDAGSVQAGGVFPPADADALPRGGPRQRKRAPTEAAGGSRVWGSRPMALEMFQRAVELGHTGAMREVRRLRLRERMDNIASSAGRVRVP